MRFLYLYLPTVYSFLEYFFMLELQALAKPHLAGKISFCLQKQKLLATASSWTVPAGIPSEHFLSAGTTFSSWEPAVTKKDFLSCFFHFYCIIWGDWSLGEPHFSSFWKAVWDAPCTFSAWTGVFQPFSVSPFFQPANTYFSSVKFHQLSINSESLS